MLTVGGAGTHGICVTELRPQHEKSIGGLLTFVITSETLWETKFKQNRMILMGKYAPTTHVLKYPKYRSNDVLLSFIFALTICTRRFNSASPTGKSTTKDPNSF